MAAICGPFVLWWSNFAEIVFRVVFGGMSCLADSIGCFVGVLVKLVFLIFFYSSIMMEIDLCFHIFVNVIDHYFENRYTENKIA